MLDTQHQFAAYISHIFHHSKLYKVIESQCILDAQTAIIPILQGCLKLNDDSIWKKTEAKNKYLHIDNRSSMIFTETPQTKPNIYRCTNIIPLRTLSNH